MSGIEYKPTIDGDLMQIVDGKEVGALGVRLSPDTADLFASAPKMKARLAAVEVERDEARRVAISHALRIIRAEEEHAGKPTTVDEKQIMPFSDSMKLALTWAKEKS